MATIGMFQQVEDTVEYLNSFKFMLSYGYISHIMGFLCSEFSGFGLCKGFTICIE
jgi:hypothetical protein